MTTYLDPRRTSQPQAQAAASHMIIVELPAGQQPDLVKGVCELIANLAVTPSCTRYTLEPHPAEERTWLIQGDWDCSTAMNGHFQSSALQALLDHLRSLRAYRMEFSCQVGH